MSVFSNQFNITMAKTTKKTLKKKTTSKKSVSKNAAKYVDGFLLPLKTTMLSEYKKVSNKARKVWLEHGALNYIESIGDDMNIEGMTGFGDYIKPAKDESIVFAFITYKSKADRNRVNKKVMADPRLTEDCFNPDKMPFDLKKMAYGGFKVIVGE